jgi:hypothetical protein
MALCSCRTGSLPGKQLLLQFLHRQSIKDSKPVVVFSSGQPAFQPIRTGGNVFSVRMALHVKQNLNIEIDWPFLWVLERHSLARSWPMKNYGVSLPEFDTRVANGTCLFTPLPTAGSASIELRSSSKLIQGPSVASWPPLLRHQTGGGGAYSAAASRRAYE